LKERSLKEERSLKSSKYNRDMSLNNGDILFENLDDDEIVHGDNEEAVNTKNVPKVPEEIIIEEKTQKRVKTSTITKENVEKGKEDKKEKKKKKKEKREKREKRVKEEKPVEKRAKQEEKQDKSQRKSLEVEGERDAISPTNTKSDVKRIMLRTSAATKKAKFGSAKASTSFFADAEPYKSD
jgi:hypothetical protein